MEQENISSSSSSSSRKSPQLNGFGAMTKDNEIQILSEEDSAPEEGELTAESSEDIFTISFPSQEQYNQYGGSRLTKVILEHFRQVENVDVQHTILHQKDNKEEIRILFTAVMGEGKRPTTTTTTKEKSANGQSTPEIVSPHHSPLLSKILASGEQQEQQMEDGTELRKTPESIIDVSKLFCVDTTPVGRYNPSSIPSYDRTTNDSLLDEEFAAQKKLAEERNALKRNNSTTTCFNCGQVGHVTRKCNLPLNQKRIQDARKAQSKVERYCDSVASEFSHLKPGVISDRLRQALDIRNDELPFFFYRMRVLGYPPGWLEDAKMESSGIKLFNYNEQDTTTTTTTTTSSSSSNVDAKNSKPPTEQNQLEQEEEEEKKQQQQQQPLYNMSQIINFPGFNQHPGDKFYDAYVKHNVPPFSRLQSKKEFIKRLGCMVFKGYKRRRLNSDVTGAHQPVTELSSSTATDMVIVDSESEEVESVADSDVEIQNRESSNEVVEKKETMKEADNTINLDSDENPEEEEEGEVTEEGEGKSMSMSLTYLEQKQNELLHELEEITSVDSVNSLSGENNDNSGEANKDVELVEEEKTEEMQDDNEDATDVVVLNDEEKEKQDEKQEEKDKAKDQKEKEIVEVVDLESNGEMPEKSTKVKTSTEEVTVTAIGTCTNVHMGTPILKFSPYETLPQNDNFKVGVSDVINFENLTNSTGKYVQMQKVLQKVRTIVGTIKSQEELY